MATHASALKRHRQSIKRRNRNRSAKSAIRTAIKDTVKLVEAGSSDEALKQAQQAASLLNKAATKGLIHKNNAARRISRLYSRLGAAQTAAK